MDGVAEMLREHVDAGSLPGAVALRFRQGRTDAVVVGAQDTTSGTPMSRETLFFWDSLGKPLTAALALTFVAEGSIDLRSPIDRWLPELTGPRVLIDPSGRLADTVPVERPVTVEDLLTLRGGLGLTTDFESPFAEALFSRLQEGPVSRTMDREAFLRVAGELPLAHQPGQGWTYNTGSTLLGLVLERVADLPLDVLMSRRIAEPLGMCDTRWWIPSSEHHRFASRYRPTDDPHEPLELIDPPGGQFSNPPPFPDGAGGMIGTADDWLAFGTMLLNGGMHRGRSILPGPLVESMLSDQLTADQRQLAGVFLTDGEGWGYGGSVRSDGTYGWAGGAGTTARVDPHHETVTVLMTQVALDGPHGSPVLAEFERLVAAREG